MESEKVKELKDYIQKSADLGQYYMLAGGKITMMEVVNYINELESENEKLQNKNYRLEQNLGQCENGYKLELHTSRCQLHSANEDLDKAKDRIAELEKENAKLLDSVETVQSNRCVYKCVLTKEHLKQFAERLKKDFTKKKNKLIKEREIAIKYDDFILIDALAYKIDELQYAIDNIDETLKEFTE